MRQSRFVKVCFAVALVAIAASRAAADPQPHELLKFYQMPLNNGFTPYLPVGTYPPTPTGTPGAYGTVPSSALFPGHDELSTAYASAYANDPTGAVIPIAWRGQYMADDFADYANTPVTHVRWWGSYMNPTVGGTVKKFLISFEHNIPAGPDPNNPGVLLPSRPDPIHPGNLHQIVDFTAGALPPAPGKFTEIPVITPTGPVPPREALWEYNAELNPGKWFYEQAAKQGANNVYWLKIVALVDPQIDGQLQWGWHNRDWSIPNSLAARPGDTPDGAERIIGGVPVGPDIVAPVWHFEDNAVSGRIDVFPGMSPIMPVVQQVEAIPQHYLPPWDGPSLIEQYSKDLAFELYTVVPEPASALLALIGLSLVVIRAGRRR